MEQKSIRKFSIEYPCGNSNGHPYTAWVWMGEWKTFLQYVEDTDGTKAINFPPSKIDKRHSVSYYSDEWALFVLIIVFSKQINGICFYSVNQTREKKCRSCAKHKVFLQFNSPFVFIALNLFLSFFFGFSEAYVASFIRKKARKNNNF